MSTSKISSKECEKFVKSEMRAGSEIALPESEIYVNTLLI